MSDPRYLRDENALPELIEECGEVIKECGNIIHAGGKMLRWGALSTDQATCITYDNALDVRTACANLEKEIDDLRAAIVRFREKYR